MKPNRTILITGAATGIGRAIAESFAADEAHHLILLDRDQAALQAWLSDANHPASSETHSADISDLAQLSILFDTLAKRLLSIDVLVNCAGICDENEPEDIDNWHRVIQVNLNGTFYVTALCLPLINAGGRIINLSSILGRAGKARNTAYCASKHGIIGMTKGLAIDLAPRKITVNAVLPAWVDTPMLQRELQSQAGITGMPAEQILRNARKKLPLRRFIQSDEVAAMVRYLASPEAAGVTAQSLVIDGGVGLGM